MAEMAEMAEMAAVSILLMVRHLFHSSNGLPDRGILSMGTLQGLLQALMQGVFQICARIAPEIRAAV